jgi:stage II sporulation protein AA (anti-sigma F factor antagonist)
MQTQTSKVNNIEVVAVSGRLDPAASIELKKVFTPLLSGGAQKLVVDLAGVEYIGSAGLRELFFAAKTLERAGGKLACCSLQPEVKRIFDIAGFSIPYQVYASRDEAVASF